MSSAVTVRRGRAEDVPVIGRLGAKLVEEHFEFDSERFLRPRPDMPELYGQFLGSQMERGDRFVLVAERDGEVVGYAFGGMEGNDYMALRGPAGVLYDLVVAPDHRRQGIGMELMNAALAALTKLGAPRVVLFTAEKNSPAQRLFERSGFRRTMVEMTRELGEEPGS
jgi:ribosomal protein S18 acetylase RimI-like enzyme